jgi:hypothetical protein
MVGLAMFGIGNSAKLGPMSARMLRHYDASGCCGLPWSTRPADTGPTAPTSGLPHRVFALEGLGFTVQQVQAIIGNQVSDAGFGGMLRLLRGQLEAQMAADASHLGRVRQGSG